MVLDSKCRRYTFFDRFLAAHYRCCQVTVCKLLLVAVAVVVASFNGPDAFPEVGVETVVVGFGH